MPRIALLIASLAGIGAAIAGPAAAQAPVTQAAQDRHYESLWNPQGRLCFERQQRETLELEKAITVCLKSLDALAKKRRALRSPKPFELADFDYNEAMLLSGLGAAYALRDGTDTRRTCQAVERLWAIAVRLQAVSKDAVSAKWYASYQRLPGSMTDVVLMCRERGGTPDGAPSMPL